MIEFADFLTGDDDPFALDFGPELLSLKPSKTALSLSSHELDRGRDLVEDYPEEWGSVSAHDAADLFNTYYDPTPTLEPACEDPLKAEYLSKVMANPDWQTTHQATALDELASEVAGYALSRRLVELRQQVEQERQRREEEEQEQEESEEPEDEESGEEGEGPGLTDAEKALAGAAAAAAAKDAAEDDAAARETARAFGMGPGGEGSDLKREDLLKLFRRVRHNEMLQNIVDEAGRMRRFSQSRRRRRVKHGSDDVMGVTLGGELARLLPSELVQLDDEDRELSTLARILEHEALVYQLQGKDRVGKGPVIVVVDESGSMEIHAAQAKAFALTMALRARQEKRWCGLVAFSGDTGHRLLTLRPDSWPLAQLEDWLTRFLGQGSDRDVPVLEMPGYYQRLGAPQGQTDLIWITDAICRVSKDMADRFNSWKAEVQCELTTLVIGEGSGGRYGGLELISNKIQTVGSIDLEEQAVADCLSR